MTDYTYLQFIQLTDVSNWSVQYLKWTGFSYNKKFVFVKIGDFLTRNKTQIDVQNWQEYKRVTIKMNNNGVFLRDVEKWENIWTKKQFIATWWEFIMSKIDARNGAFGIVPEDLTWAIITNDFPSFKVNKNLINIDFFVLILWTKEFLDFAQQWSSGTTWRQRVDMDVFLNTKIPLPSLEEQNKIVKAYTAKLQDALDAEKKAWELEWEIESYLMEELGIDMKTQENWDIWLQFINFQNLKEWSIEKLLENSNISSKKYNLVKFEDICDRISDWTHQTPTYINKEDWVVFISSKDVTSKEINWEDIKYIPRSLHEQISRNFRPKIWDIFLAKNWTTWVAAMLTEEKEFAIYVSLAHISPIREKINSTFFLDYINSSCAKFQFDKNLIWVWVPNLHLSKIRSAKIPLPPLEIQERIVAHISWLKHEIKQLKTLVNTLRQQAKVEFEEEIFN